MTDPAVQPSPYSSDPTSPAQAAAPSEQAPAADPAPAAPADPAPTVARVVHYHQPSPDPALPPVARPALVVEGYQGSVLGLSVHTPEGVFYAVAEPSGAPAPGCWTWPPRA